MDLSGVVRSICISAASPDADAQAEAKRSFWVTWEQAYIPSGTDKNLLAIDLADAQIGWVVGFGGTILATSDGGPTR